MLEMLRRWGALAFKGISVRYTDPVVHTPCVERKFLLGKLIGKPARAFRIRNLSAGVWARITYVCVVIGLRSERHGNQGRLSSG